MHNWDRLNFIKYILFVGEEFAPLFFSNEAGLSTRVAEQLIPKGYTNDESHLNLTRVDSVINVSSNSTELINQLKSLLEYAKTHDLKVSIAGTKHSMGGHTITKDGIQLNMLPFNEMSLDTMNNILTIDAGAT